MWYLITAIVIIILILIKVNHISGPWEHSDKVVHGHKKMREHDWKTANIVNCPKKTKELGFYSCTTNYGKGTLVRNAHHCEVHIHNFDGDIYGEELKLKNIVQHKSTTGNVFNITS
jgi:FAD synthase